MVNEDKKTAFIRAVRANKYCHIEIDDDLFLITDITEDGEFTFNPYLSIEDESIDVEQIEEELEKLNFIKFDGVNIVSEKGINFDFGEIENAKFIDPKLMEN